MPADTLDLASEIEGSYRNNKINEINAKLREQSSKVTRKLCIECDAPIPKARRLAVPGVQTCITCQTELERKKALGIGDRDHE